MLKHIILGLFLISLMALPVQAAHVSLPPIPSNQIITGDSGAYQWVWIAPCAPPDGDGCSLKHGVEGYGFGAPTTTAQWTESFTGYQDMYTSFINFNTLPFATALCSASLFSQEHTECSPGDLNAGAIWRSPFAPPVTADLRTSSSAESFWLRATPGFVPPVVNPPVVVVTPVDPVAVPEPSTALLLGIVIAVVGMLRVKKIV